MFITYVSFVVLWLSCHLHSILHSTTSCSFFDPSLFIVYFFIILCPCIFACDSSVPGYILPFPFLTVACDYSLFILLLSPLLWLLHTCQTPYTISQSSVLCSLACNYSGLQKWWQFVKNRITLLCRWTLKILIDFNVSPLLLLNLTTWYTTKYLQTSNWPLLNYMNIIFWVLMIS